jgi:hypothetical protein
MNIDGKVLIVTPSSFGEAMSLQTAIVKALKENGIKVDLSGISFSEEDILKTEVGDIGWLLEPVLTVSTDPIIRELLFKCCKRASFGPEKTKIDVDFFEEPENRKYYYPIMMEVLKVNISPFFGFASSVFSKLKGLTDKYLKSKSEQPKKT